MTERITPARAMELLDYDPESGVLRWKQRPARCIAIGDVAGALKQDGYISVTIARKSYPAHHLAWAIVNGSWPLMLDHINGNKADNRIYNLRECDVSLNTQNQRRAHKSNLSAGLLGVHYLARTRRWRATIWANGRNHYLGYHPTAEEAQRVYIEAKRKLHAGNTL